MILLKDVCCALAVVCVVLRYSVLCGERGRVTGGGVAEVSLLFKCI